MQYLVHYDKFLEGL